MTDSNQPVQHLKLIHFKTVHTGLESGHIELGTSGQSF